MLKRNEKRDCICCKDHPTKRDVLQEIEDIKKKLKELEEYITNQDHYD